MTAPTDPKPSPAPPAAGEAAQAGFATLPLPASMLATLGQLAYHTMTPIQAASLPLALAGHDLIAQAKTGSGKTVAFALCLLNRLEVQRLAVQALVLCPTRELADQVTQAIRQLARSLGNVKVLSLCGGSPMRPQTASLAHGAHIVVGTPGRLMDHIARGTLDLQALSTLVLDEADRMLDMGFVDDIRYVARHCPRERQTLLFSATYPEGIVRLAADLLRAPQQVRLDAGHSEDTIRQRFYLIDHAARLQAVGALLRHYRPQRALAFCNTRQQCRELLQVLRAEGFEAAALHGEMEQRERDQVLIRFTHGSCTVLVATDVAARGLDISDLEMVINVDMTPDAETHTHRVGRTGRAEKDGWALSLCSEADRRRLAITSEQNGFVPEWHDIASLTAASDAPLLPAMVTLQIAAGRRDKIRPGDVLGALAAEAQLTRDEVGKITVTDQSSYVAVKRDVASRTLAALAAGKLKGRRVKVRILTD